MIILDTDHLTLIESASAAESSRLRGRLANIPPADVATTIITYEEQTRGWLAYAAGAKTIVQQVQAYAKLLHHLETYRRIRVMPFDPPAAVEFQRLARLRLRIGTMDLRISSIALSRGATLLTRNAKDFSKVPGLDVQDWS